MTLIELMIVIVILALAAGAVIVGLGAITDANLRSAALRVVSASRFAYGRATTRGNTVRLLFDFDAHTMAVEEAEGADGARLSRRPTARGRRGRGGRPLGRSGGTA